MLVRAVKETFTTHKLLLLFVVNPCPPKMEDKSVLLKIPGTSDISARELNLT